MARAAVLGRLTWTRARLLARRPETARAATLTFDVPGWPGHLAGQHVDVRLTADDGYTAQRSYSVASPPEAAALELTVERLEEGEVSPYLVDDLPEGAEVEIRGPIGGHFVWSADRIEPLGLVAGGSGIVPLMCILRHRVAANYAVPASLLLSARTAEDVIYRDDLAALADTAGTSVAITTTREPNPRATDASHSSLAGVRREDAAGPGRPGPSGWDRERPAGWDGLTGRVDRRMLEERLPLPSREPAIFVCGPTSFVEAVADMLVEIGHGAERIKTERFGPTGG